MSDGLDDTGYAVALMKLLCKTLDFFSKLRVNVLLLLSNDGLEFSKFNLKSLELAKIIRQGCGHSLVNVRTVGQEQAKRRGRLTPGLCNLLVRSRLIGGHFESEQRRRRRLLLKR